MVKLTQAPGTPKTVFGRFWDAVMERNVSRQQARGAAIAGRAEAALAVCHQADQRYQLGHEQARKCIARTDDYLERRQYP